MTEPLKPLIHCVVTFGAAGGSTTYYAYYGPLSRTGIATYAEMIAATGGGQCTVQITFSLK